MNVEQQLALCRFFELWGLNSRQLGFIVLFALSPFFMLNLNLIARCVGLSDSFDLPVKVLRCVTLVVLLLGCVGLSIGEGRR